MNSLDPASLDPASPHSWHPSSSSPRLIQPAPSSKQPRHPAMALATIGLGFTERLEARGRSCGVLNRGARGFSGVLCGSGEWRRAAGILSDDGVRGDAVLGGCFGGRREDTRLRAGARGQARGVDASSGVREKGHERGAVFCCAVAAAEHRLEQREGAKSKKEPRARRSQGGPRAEAGTCSGERTGGRAGCGRGDSQRREDRSVSRVREREFAAA